MTQESETVARPFLTPGRIILVLIVLGTALVAGISVFTNTKTMYGAWEQAGQKKDNPQFQSRQLEPLEIVSGDRRHRLSVEVMRTEGDRARGLMYRRYMAPEEGMLFDFGSEQNVSMWMKNTFISLDMVFIRADGRIHRIEQRTEPESEKIIPAGAPVRGVLELNAGMAIRLNLKPGDYIRHPVFQ